MIGAVECKLIYLLFNKLTKLHPFTEKLKRLLPFGKNKRKKTENYLNLYCEQSNPIIVFIVDE